jgi:hypothetical protein
MESKTGKAAFGKRPPCAFFLLTAILGATPAVAQDNRTLQQARPEGAPANAATSWLSEVRGQIEAAEYEVTWQTSAGLAGIDAAYQAANRAQRFRTYFTEKGILSIPRNGNDPAWQWGLTWVGYGRGGASWAVPAAVLSVRGNRVDLQRGIASEWYVNGVEGLEQRFFLPYPPEEMAMKSGSFRLSSADMPGSGRGLAPRDLLHIDLALTGTLQPEIAADGQSTDFITPAGARALRYSKLRVTDANDRPLPSWMEGFSGADVRGVRLVIDARDAVYPLEKVELRGTRRRDDSGAAARFDRGAQRLRGMPRRRDAHRRPVGVGLEVHWKVPTAFRSRSRRLTQNSRNTQRSNVPETMTFSAGSAVSALIVVPAFYRGGMAANVFSMFSRTASVDRTPACK